MTKQSCPFIIQILNRKDHILLDMSFLILKQETLLSSCKFLLIFFAKNEKFYNLIENFVLTSTPLTHLHVR